MIFVRQIAVLGAGVMGSQIAAQIANAGYSVLLFDLPGPAEKPNAITEAAIARLQTLKPPPLAIENLTAAIRACNFQDDLAQLKHCDLIIEVIAEQLELKRDLYQKISPFLHENAIVVSNTSGLSLHALQQYLPVIQQQYFCGMHFFNPPRYLSLVELIPTSTTSSALLDELAHWLTCRLGKNVIRAKDTPNFIANRIGVFSLLSCIHQGLRYHLALDEVDALTGALLLRPKSATYRTLDVVGLDTMQHVVHTLQGIADDPWRDTFQLPEFLQSLIAQGHLGQKTGQGIYRKQGKVIEVYDIQQQSYRPAAASVDPDLFALLSTCSISQCMQELRNMKSPQAQFLLAYWCDLLHYSAYHLQAIAHSVQDVDHAMQWGYGWQEGPFIAWQNMGIERMLDLIKDHSQIALPTWLEEVKRAGFYTHKGAYSPQENTYISEKSILSQKLNHLVKNEEVAEFLSSSSRKNDIPKQLLLTQEQAYDLWALTDKTLVFCFKTKTNVFDNAIIEGLNQALNEAEQTGKGLIIYQYNAETFSGGADLNLLMALIQTSDWQGLDLLLQQFQHILMRIKYSPNPTIVALRGRALGAGCELLLHARGVVAAMESYPGLVETSVGLIPAGGGCKEMALRTARQANGYANFSYLKNCFERILLSKVASSAAEGFAYGYLGGNPSVQTPHWVMHKDDVLRVALTTVDYLFASQMDLPAVQRPFVVAGREGKARLQMQLVNAREGRFINDYQYQMGNALAHILCGGDVDEGTLVDEAWLLRLEREAFVHLAKQAETQALLSKFTKGMK